MHITCAHCGVPDLRERLIFMAAMLQITILYEPYLASCFPHLHSRKAFSDSLPDVFTQGSVQKKASVWSLDPAKLLNFSFFMYIY